MKILRDVARGLIEQSKRAPIPRSAPEIGPSAFVRDSARNEVSFGFSHPHSQLHDGIGLVFPRKIVPIRKKILYIPLTPRGRLHKY